MSDLIENGLEPEFHVTEIALTEAVGDGPMVRVYFACQKHGSPALQFTMIGAPPDLIRMASQILEIAAGVADALALQSCLETAKTH